MAFLLDTNHCIYLMNGLDKSENRRSDPELHVIRRVSQCDEELFTSWVTVGELLYGAALSGRPEYNRKRVEMLCELIEPIALTESSWNHFGALKASLQRVGSKISDFDLLIACTAIVEKHILVTNDRDFDVLPVSFEKTNWALPS